MTKRFISLLLIAVLLPGVFCLTSCRDQTADGLQIVTTIFPPYDFARQIVQDGGNVTMLLAPGEEAHTYEPSPKDLITVQNCDLFICVGGETEAWVDRLLSSLDGELRVIRMMDCVSVLTEETVEGMTVPDGETASEEEWDEHVWTSPRNAAVILDAICNALCEIAPQSETVFRERAHAYRTQIEELDAAFTALFADGGEIVVADRFPFRYLASAYSVTYHAAYPGCADDAEPSSATVRYLIDLVKENRIGTVYTIEFSNGKLAQTVSEETGCRIAELHSCHNVTRSDFESGVTYVDLMRRNLTVLGGN